MSIYASNGKRDLGQFASSRGYSDLIEASRHDNTLKSFFDDASADSKDGVDAVASALRSLKAPKDVKHTADGLADMIDGEDLVFITNGTHDGGDEAAEKGFGDDAYEGEDTDEQPEEPDDEYEDADKFEMRGSIVKVAGDNPQHLVFGWFSIVSIGGKTIEDTQGDLIESAVLEAAAYDFVLHARVASEMHETKPDGSTRGIGRLVESCVFTVEKQNAMVASLHAQGITDAVVSLGCVAWFGGFKVDDPDTWDKITSGELKAFSIGGKGKRAAV